MPIENVLLSVDDKEKAFNLQALFENSPSPVLISDLSQRIVFTNPAADRFFRTGTTKLIGSSIRTLFSTTELTEYTEQTEDNQTNWNSVIQTPMRFSARTISEQLNCEIQQSPIRNCAGSVEYILFVVLQILGKPGMEQTLKALQRITSSRDLTFEQRVEKILSLGVGHFGLPIACLSRVEGKLYTVMHVIDPKHQVQPGMTFDLADTYCDRVMKADKAVGYHHFSQSHSKSHTCFHHFGLEAYIGAPIYVDGTRFGTITFSSPEPTTAFEPTDLEVIELFASWIGHEIAREGDINSLERAQHELERLASEDPLTRLLNRRSIERWFKTESARAARYKLTMSAGLLDIDNFKKINDSLGHDAGDRVLVELASLCRHELRETDAVARWGGEELLFLFNHTSTDEAETVLSRIASHFRELDLGDEVSSQEFTFSAGIVPVRPAETLTAVVSRADSALYTAKRAGKNRIVRAE